MSQQPPQGLGIRDLLGLGGTVTGCVVVGLALGWWADASFDSTPALTLLGLALGVVAGVVSTYRTIRPLLGGGGTDEHAPDRGGSADDHGPH